ncbi:hypothetical protein [Deinococcus sp.]|uniref:hypothetical protein n=1 Tax=Deinococcus sp. TaxID=47478 RepID=UPI0025CD1F9D|nr:hypothetical protein [Deinococcus sp.]
MSDGPDPRHGTRFAVYAVPPAGGEYYRLGTRLLGYDLRARQHVALPDFLRPEWQRDAGPYGLHLTVVEGFYTGPEHLGAIEAEARACLNCLSPGAVMSLHGGCIAEWDGGETWVHLFTPSLALSVIQTLLLARLSPFVTASPFSAAAAQGRWNTPHERARLQLLRTPRGLDSYQPHFTLIQPYGGDPAGLRQRLEALTRPHHQMHFAALALCVKPEGESHWHVRSEFGPHT